MEEVDKTESVVRFQHSTTNDDPEKVDLRHAAIVMIVRDDPEFQVLMVQRASKAVFGASAWVFPGGRVDPEDAVPDPTLAVGRTDEEASEILEVPGGGLAWWIAAIRETIEEAGLLLLDEAASLAVGPDALAEVRSSVQADSAALFPKLAEHGLQLDLGALYEVARFITPVGPPRRFDTRFFIAAAPVGQVVSPDESEVVNARWVSPAEALDLWSSDDFPLMSVTHRMLACLRRYDDVHAVLATARSRPESRRVRVNDPEGAYEVLLPEDPGYEDADLEIEHGWVRL